MNKAFLIGRLTRDPELRYSSSNAAIANFSIAIDRQYTNGQGQRETDFINIVVWRKQAENVKNYLKQGSQVAIDGRIQTRSYDGEDGKKRYITEVVADNVQFLDTKNARAEQSTEPSVNPYDFGSESPASQTNVDNDPFKDFGEEIKIEDDDLPF